MLVYCSRLMGMFLVLASLGSTAAADVGQCWVLFVYRPAGHKSVLDAKQQQEIGERLTKAHLNSDVSDWHIVFVCYLDDDPANPDLVYRISEPKDGFPKVAEGYQITARDFPAMRQAIAVVEEDFKKGGPKKRVLKDSPAKGPNAR
ncbi:MAG: hypothetical protein KF777_14860 [Planctomycetaceae bacterium]|nr:hypothetical protein [Planctomycetaceae bacterium]